MPVGMMLWGASVLVGAGVFTTEDLDSVGMGTTAMVESSDDVVALPVGDAFSVPLVIADSAEPGLVDVADSEAPVVSEESGVVDASVVAGDASEASVVAVDASEAPEVVVTASEAPEVVVAASEAPEVVVAASEAPVVVASASEAVVAASEAPEVVV